MEDGRSPCHAWHAVRHCLYCEVEHGLRVATRPNFMSWTRFLAARVGRALPGDVVRPWTSDDDLMLVRGCIVCKLAYAAVFMQVGELISRNGGVVTAEQLAPYLDPPADYREGELNEDFVVPALVRFGGSPSVDDAGQLLYTFPSLQVRPLIIEPHSCALLSLAVSSGVPLATVLTCPQ